MAGFFDDMKRCVTVLPRRRSDGSTECEHIGEEHEDLGEDERGECNFCECEQFTPSEDEDDDDTA